MSMARSTHHTICEAVLRGLTRATFARSYELLANLVVG
jgi:hypothetical protein